MTTPPSLYDLTLAELTEWFQAQGQPAYRAKQIFHELYQRGIADVGAITTLPKSFREKLAAAFPVRRLELAQKQESSDGTVKYLSTLPDEQFVETVMIPAAERESPVEADSGVSAPRRRTVCVSTQVGCAYGCAFCASGLAGFKRNLSAGEIVQQVLMASKPEKVTNIVFMGMGEPLSNYDNLLKAIRILNAPEGFAIGARKITISTVGLVPMIERLSAEGIQVELSISLHAPNDELRGKLMPVNKKYAIAELIQACRAYVQATKRLITFEYILIDQVNDGVKEAQELVALLQGLLCKVNLIPCHPIPGQPWGRPALPRMLAFEKQLRIKGLPCTLRRSRGLDIDGACGQLRLRRETQEAKIN